MNTKTQYNTQLIRENIHNVDVTPAVILYGSRARTPCFEQD
jgi:hypothetical protein